MLTPEQLLRRRDSIGGSDIAALLGVSPWKTAYDIYLEKIGEAAIEKDKQHLKRGNEAQSVVLRRYEQESGLQIEQEDVVIVHTTYPFLVGNVDAICEEGRTLVEAKTTSKSRSEWDRQLPEYYKTQVAFYSALYEKANMVEIPVAFKFNYAADKPIEIIDFDILNYYPNLKYEKSLIDMAVDFWESNVLKRVPPVLRTIDDIKKRYAVAEDTEIQTTAEVHAAVQRIAEINRMMKDLEADKEEAEFKVREYMQENSYLVDESGKRFASYKNQMRNYFDKDALKEDNPALVDSYTKQTQHRVFRLIGNGKKND